MFTLYSITYRKMKQFFLISFWIFLSVMATATDYKGRVTDKDTGEPLCGAYIVNTEGKALASTGQQGEFTVDLNSDSAGMVTVTVSFIGYKTLSKSFSADASVLDIELTPSSEHLDAVSVIAANTVKINIDKVYSKTSVQKEYIAENIQTSLIDVLETVPGLYKKADYHSPIVLRGLSGKRLLITLNGNRRMGSTSKGFTGHKINIYSLEKVEVIKGPASVKYGPGAIAGIINMVTLSPFVEKGIGGHVRTYYGINNNEKMAQMEVMGSNDRHAFTLAARYDDADNYHSAAGEERTNSFHTDNDFAATYAFRPNERFSISFESSVRIGGPWGRPHGFNGCDYLDCTINKDNNYHIATTAIWKPSEKVERVEASLYFDKDEREDQTVYTNISDGELSGEWDHTYNNYYGGWRLHLVKPFWHNSTLTVGTDGVHYRATTPYSFTDYYDPMELEVTSIDHAGVTMGGLFAENVMPLANERLKWTLGIRGDFANVYEGQLDPKTGDAPRNENFLVYNATTGTTYEYAKDNFLSLNMARSCRMPDVTELFVETTTSDAHIFGNADLNPEYGLGVDLGMRGSIYGFRYDLTLYSNFLRDFITCEAKEGSGMPGYCYEYVNIDRTHIYGGELSLGYVLDGLLGSKDVWEYNSYYVITKGYEIDEGAGWIEHSDPLLHIPPFNTRHELTCRYRFSHKTTVFAGTNFLFFARRTEYPADSYETGRYTLLGGKIGIKHQADNGLGYNFSIVGTNLTDERYTAFESIVYGMGRNFKVMVNVEFGSRRGK